jgi:DNA-binding NtrC family response regulator
LWITRGSLLGLLQERTLRNVEPAPIPQKPAVLLVDDARVVLKVIERALSAVGFTLSVAEDEAEALRLIDDQEFTCALIDRNLVGADGLDLIKRIRERQPRCACVLMTAYPSVPSAVEALRLGVVDYIQKPSPDFDVIADRVQSAIRLHRSRGGGEAVREGLRVVERLRGEVLVHSAEAIVASLKSLQSKMKAGARGAFNRALAAAEAHVSLLRGR